MYQKTRVITGKEAEAAVAAGAAAIDARADRIFELKVRVLAAGDTSPPGSSACCVA